MSDPRSEPMLDDILEDIVEHGADHARWDQYRALVVAGDASWEELAEALSVEHNLRLTAAPALRAQEHVTLPAAPAALTQTPGRSWLTGSGWAAALLLALAWWSQGIGSDPQPATVHARTADEAFRHYLAVGAETGEVVRALPPRLVHVSYAAQRPGEVLILRRSLERADIHARYQVVEDELGARHLTPVDHIPGNLERHL